MKNCEHDVNKTDIGLEPAIKKKEKKSIEVITLSSQVDNPEWQTHSFACFFASLMVQPGSLVKHGSELFLLSENFKTIKTTLLRQQTFTPR